MTVAERRARLAVRHRLATSARVDDDPVAIARSVVVLHATDPATVVLAAVPADARHPIRRRGGGALRRRARWSGSSACVERSGRSPSTTPPSCSGRAAMRWPPRAQAVRAACWRTRAWRRTAPAGCDGRRPRRWPPSRTPGELAAGDLSKAVPELAVRVPMNEGKAYAATHRARPAGAPPARRRRAGGAGPHHRRVDQQPPPLAPAGRVARPPDPRPAGRGGTGRARRAVARPLRSRRPSTDLKWWTGWTLGHTRAALADLDVEAVDLDGEEGIVLAGDTDTDRSEPFVALLPGLDPTTMGWKQRAWYLGDHRPRIFDTHRQRRAHGVGRRPHRRRLGAAQDRRGGVPAARGHRRGSGPTRWREQAGRLERLLARGAGGGAVPRPARPGALRVTDGDTGGPVAVGGSVLQDPRGRHRRVPRRARAHQRTPGQGGRHRGRSATRWWSGPTASTAPSRCASSSRSGSAPAWPPTATWTTPLRRRHARRGWRSGSVVRGARPSGSGVSSTAGEAAELDRLRGLVLRAPRERRCGTRGWPASSGDGRGRWGRCCGSATGGTPRRRPRGP